MVFTVLTIPGEVAADPFANAGLIVLAGLQGAGKTTFRQRLASARPELQVVSFDDLRRPLPDGRLDQSQNDAVLQRGYQMAREAAAEGRTVLVDATSTTARARAPWLQIPIPAGRERVFVLLDCPLPLAEERVERRASSGGHRVPLHVVRRYYRQLSLPLLTHDRSRPDSFDRIVWLTSDPVKAHSLRDAFLADPVGLFKRLIADERLADFCPELAACVGFEQQSAHHRLRPDGETVAEHLLATGEHLWRLSDGNPLLTLAGLMHDIGKPATKAFHAKLVVPHPSIPAGETVRLVPPGEVYDRFGPAPDDTHVAVEQMTWRGHAAGWVARETIVVDPSAHFYQHENVSAILTLRVLIRFGFSLSEAYAVASLVQRHMSLPFRIDDWQTERAPRRWLRLAGPEAEDLLLLRHADKLGSGGDPAEIERYVASLRARLETAVPAARPQQRRRAVVAGHAFTG